MRVLVHLNAAAKAGELLVMQPRTGDSLRQVPRVAMFPPFNLSQSVYFDGPAATQAALSDAELQFRGQPPRLCTGCQVWVAGLGK